MCSTARHSGLGVRGGSGGGGGGSAPPHRPRSSSHIRPSDSTIRTWPGRTIGVDYRLCILMGDQRFSRGRYRCNGDSACASVGAWLLRAHPSVRCHASVTRGHCMIKMVRNMSVADLGPRQLQRCPLALRAVVDILCETVSLELAHADACRCPVANTTVTPDS